MKGVRHFIGLGGQRCGTSWLYACLFEHPEVCAPDKELNFFSRDRYAEGIDAYWSRFISCSKGKVTGEISVSYISTPGTAGKIAEHIPDAKLFVAFRNPVTRAYSQYINSIKTGKRSKDVSFETALKEDNSFIEQGKYHTHLQEYLQKFPRENIHIMIYEDSEKDPKTYLAELYAFLGIDNSFSPKVLEERVNVTRIPKVVAVDTTMISISSFLRRLGLGKIVWLINRSKIPLFIRSLNSSKKTDDISEEKLHQLFGSTFTNEARQLGELLGRDLVKEWGLVNES